MTFFSFNAMPGYMQQQKPGAQIMCAVRSSAIVLPTDTRGKGRGLLGCVGKGISFKSDAGVGCVSFFSETGGFSWWRVRVIAWQRKSC